jgi:hypothetical protein
VKIKLAVAIIIIVVILLIVLTAGTAYLIGLNNPNSNIVPMPNPVIPSGTTRACTMEAKVCPDGSSVGRVGPNCEFAPCPK